MARTRLARLALLGGAPLVVALAVWFGAAPDAAAPARPGQRSPEPAPRAQHVAARPAVPAKVATAAAPAPAAPAVDIRQTLAAQGEAERVARRERKLDELDWSAPRPGPPPRDPPISKTEAALSPAEKLAQTVQVISLLKTRIEHTRARMQSNPARGSDGVLLTRLEQRVGQLEQRVEALRKAQDAPPTGSAPASAGAPG